jgi:hypothetical protein
VSAVSIYQLPIPEYGYFGCVLLITTIRRYERHSQPTAWEPSVKVSGQARTICSDVDQYGFTRDTEDGQRKQQIRQLKATSYRKIFAILLFVGRSHRITAFIDEGVSDAGLPLVGRDTSRAPWVPQCGRASPSKSSIPQILAVY